MDEPNRVGIERLSTGNAEMDGILGGGIPAYSMNVIAGGPGTGKSVLALSTIFHQARQGKKAIYFTTVSEPALKLFRYMQQFAFFDQALVDDRVLFFDLGSPARSEGVDKALEVCLDQVEKTQPDIVAVDSFRALHDLMRDPERARAFVYDLGVNLAAWRTTTFLVGEYGAEEIGRYPEFAVADCIIHLLTAMENLRAAREIEVLKLRGSGYTSGRHFFDITASGLVVYPRVAVPKEQEDELVEVEAPPRRPIGVPGLDEMLRGGLPEGSVTLIEGGTGTGKTLLSLSFLIEGARQGEPGLLFTMEETRAQIFRMAAGRGWDLQALERQGLLRVIYTSPVELAGDTLLQRARQEVARLGARRVVIDSVTSLGLSFASEGRFRELVYAMAKVFSGLGITTVMTNEIAELLGQSALTGHGVSSIADNIILLRYVELEADLRRAISVLKMRGSEHERTLRELRITGDKIEVAGPFKHLRGVLTGIPTPVERK